MIKSFREFIEELKKSNKLLLDLSKNDLKARFSASFLGAVWAFFLPLTTLLVLWYVFQVGLRSVPISDVPFIVWLVPAYLSWNFASDSISGAANSIIEYSYLVKKINFDVKLIPLVKITSASMIHLGFVLVIILLNLIYGIQPNVYYLQVFYYFFALLALLIGIAWLVSSLVPFVPDVANVVAVILQIGFWATPIVWNGNTMDESARLVLELNPFYYICEGYRLTFIGDVWFWELGWINFYYWALVIIVFVVGSRMFNRMKPHFTDVL